MKNFFRNYFTFNRRERRGVLLLLSFIALLLGYLILSKYFVSEKDYDFSTYEKEITDLEKTQKDSIDSLKEEKIFYNENEYKVPVSLTNPNPERFNFDPNLLPEADWKRLGLSDKQIHTIKNYESKGGKFRKKEDVKKMYSITPELYTSLEPFIVIPVDTVHHQKYMEKPKEVVMVELNSADSVQLDRLKGIGSSFSKRIIKYRNILGGYISKEQLLEVYGFDQDKLNLIKDNISVDASFITRININTASLDELKKHPYIKYNLAQLIINYRKQHGNYKSLNELKKLDLITNEVYDKIVPYLTTN